MAVSFLVLSTQPIRAAILLIPVVMLAASAATISGTVVDVSGKPIADVRIDHIGRLVVSTRTSLAVKPSPGEARTDAEGHFQVTTTTILGWIKQRLKYWIASWTVLL
jgi:hypothetical protein